MAGRDKNDVRQDRETPTTGHEWDGIHELDNPLPRWWLYIFYASILAAVAYWVLMPAWPAAKANSRRSGSPTISS